MSGVMTVMLGLSGAPGVINTALPNGTLAEETAVWHLLGDGTYSIDGVSDSNWVTPASSVTAGYYQIKVDATVGTFSSGTTGSYVDLSTNPAWSKTSVGPPTTVTFTATIREKATGRIRSTQAGITLTADLP